MAAAPASPPEDWLERHVDPATGLPRPIAASEDFFSALGVRPGFFHDAALIQRRYYEASRALHPDRFATAGPAERELSLKRMSFVNEAYQTLKDPAALREYVLSRAGLGAKVSGNLRAAMPAELAEAWFEIQDLQAEEPELSRALVEDFQAKLKQLQARMTAEIQDLERKAESASFDAASLQALQLKVHERAYLLSLERDVQRLLTTRREGSPS